jgi:hypothetical protein
MVDLTEEPIKFLVAAIIAMILLWIVLSILQNVGNMVGV